MDAKLGTVLKGEVASSLDQLLWKRRRASATALHPTGRRRFAAPRRLPPGLIPLGAHLEVVLCDHRQA